MPRLPSGKDLAISPSPLNVRHNELAAKGVNAPWPTTVAEVAPYLEFLWLEPSATQAVQLASGSAPLPGAMRPVPTGYRLSQRDEFLASLAPDDAAFFRAYLDSDKVRAQFEAWLSVLTAESRRLRNGPYGWDLYDLFAALMRFDRARSYGLLPPDLDAPLLDDLHGMLTAVRDATPVLKDIERASESTAQFAGALRAEAFFHEERGREEFTHTLLGIAWRMAGDLWLEDAGVVDQEAVDIITLAAVGYDPETKQHVAFRDGVARAPG